MKYRVKLRVTQENGERRKYSINLEERDQFPLGDETVGLVFPEAEDPSMICRLFMRDGALMIEDRGAPGGLRVNNHPGQEFALRPGDVLQIRECSVEFLEVPVPAAATAEPANATQFLDLAEYFKKEAPAPAPEPVTPIESAAEEPPLELSMPDLAAPATLPTSRPRSILVEEPPPAEAVTAPPAPDEPETLSDFEPDAHETEEGTLIAASLAVPPAPTSEESFWSRNREVFLSTGSIAVLFGSSAGVGWVLTRGTSEVLPTWIALAIGGGIAAAALFGIVFHLMREYLHMEDAFADFLRFFGFASVLFVPAAYAASRSPSIGLFFGMLLALVGMTCFLVRFKPNLSRFFLLSGIASACLLIALFPRLRPLVPASPGETPPVVVAGHEPPPEAGHREPASAPPPVAPPTQAPTPEQVPVTPSETPAALAPMPTGTPVAAVASPPPVTPPTPESRMVDALAQEEFFTSVREGNLAVVRQLIEKRTIDPFFTLDKGQTALMVASTHGRLEVAHYLLSLRININAQDPNGTTALMWAVYRGNRAMVELLLARGANTELKRDDGVTAYELAKRWKKTDIIKIFEARASRRGGATRRVASGHRRGRRH